MANAGSPFVDHGDQRYFTPAGYRAILTRARALGYALTRFCDFAPPEPARPVLLLRHDLDHDLDSARILAGIEAEEGVGATYFVQVACDFYNLLSPSGRATIRALADLGHEIGLHYVAERYVGPDAADNLASDIRLLQDLSGQPVKAAAQHIPIDGAVVDLSAHIADEAYAPRFTAGPMTYISDSLMAWRDTTPHDLLDAGRSFQFLAHPECWVASHRSMPDVFAALKQAEIQAVERRFDTTLDHYATLLRERTERDRQFKAKRATDSGNCG